MSASFTCPHSDLDFNLNVAILGDTNLKYLELKASCKICGRPMVFRCGRVGMGPDGPGVSLDRQEITLPFLAAEEEMTGEPIGFSVVGAASP